MKTFTQVAWPVITGVVFLGVVGCTTFQVQADKEVILSCIENGGSWIDGVAKTGKPDECLMENAR